MVSLDSENGASLSNGAAWHGARPLLARSPAGRSFRGSRTAPLCPETRWLLGARSGPALESRGCVGQGVTPLIAVCAVEFAARRSDSTTALLSDP